jgi:poly(hydroxyalkanoate) depolymerase family esterase
VRSLGKTTAFLSRYRRQWQTLTAMAARTNEAKGGPPVESRLRAVPDFGSNPGALRMWEYRPERLPPAPALVVVLHGCTQNAAGYDSGAGWSTLADRYGFVVLFPEQESANNPNLCFNWFQPGDTTRGAGEALSIRQMVERAVANHGIDRRRVFVTGLSAGGAMTATMLATYPDVFAGGAIVAGLPYGAATTVQEAFESMFQSSPRPAREWGDLVRAASPHRGPWPRLSVWHGSVDATVKPANADEIVKQWTNVHGLSSKPTATDTVDGYPRNVWRDAEGNDLIEAYTITGMAHGTPLAVGDGENSVGAAGPFLLEAGISSSYHIAKFWGLTEDARAPVDARASDGEAILLPSRAEWPTGAPRPSSADQPRPERGAWEAEEAAAKPSANGPDPSGRGWVIDVGGVITRALRAAGLLKD